MLGKFYCLRIKKEKLISILNYLEEIYNKHFYSFFISFTYLFNIYYLLCSIICAKCLECDGEQIQIKWVLSWSQKSKGRD